MNRIAVVLAVCFLATAVSAQQESRQQTEERAAARRTEPLTQPYAVTPIEPGPGQALSRIVPPSPIVTLPSPPTAITLCDAGGCWDSAGQRLNRMDPGPVLQGPAGACIPVAGTVRCP